jgi:hypothetical protein
VRRANLVKRLVAAAIALWVLRWAAMMLAAYAGRYWLPVGPPPIESARKPGWMPGPFD